MSLSPSGRRPSKAHPSIAPAGLTTSVRRYAGGVLTVALFALAAAPARAQTPPVDGGTEVGGQVNSYLELIISPPDGFSTFTRAGSFTLPFKVQTTTTESVIQLSIADGDAVSGSKLGHMSAGSKRLPDPLEARVGHAAFLPLDEALDPLLGRFSGPRTRLKSTVTLRQKVRSRPSGTYRKVLLVTASSETP